jgi:O-antigen/teichoic acid export membrane protein
MSLQRRALRGVVWSGGLSVATQALNFAMVSLLARALGAHDFGEWGILQSTLGTIAILAQLSMSIAATRYVAELRHRDPRRAGSVLGLCSAVTFATGPIAGVIVWVASRHVATELLGTSDLTTPVRLSALYLIFFTLNGFQQGAIAGLEQFRPLALLGLFYGVSSAIVVPILGHAFGVGGAVAGLGVATALSWGAHHYVLRRLLHDAGIRVTYGALAQEGRVLLDFTLPATFAGIASMLGIWLSNLLVVHQTGGYEQMAALAAATNLKGLVLFAPTATSRVSMPLLTNLLGNRQHETYRHAFRRNLWLTTAAAGIIAAFVGASGKYLLFVFGHGFEGAASLVVVLAASGVLEVASLGLYQHIFCSGWMWAGLFVAALRAMTLVLVARGLVAREGALGVAWATVAAQAVAVIGSYAVIWLKGRARAEEAPSV